MQAQASPTLAHKGAVLIIASFHEAKEGCFSSREAKRHTFSKQTWKSGIEALCLQPITKTYNL